MKKSIFLAALGLITNMASSYGQGYVVFSSYEANGGVGAIASVYNGMLLNSSFTAYLYYAIGTVSDPVIASSWASTVTPVTGLTLLPGVSAVYDNSGSATGAAGLGYFDGPVAVIPGYSSGPVTFEILAANQYGTLVSRSGSFTMTSISNNPFNPFSFGDNGQPMPNIFFPSPYPSPEPTTLALAGLGGLVSLVVLRRNHL